MPIIFRVRHSLFVTQVTLTPISSTRAPMIHASGRHSSLVRCFVLMVGARVSISGLKSRGRHGQDARFKSRGGVGEVATLLVSLTLKSFIDARKNTRLALFGRVGGGRKWGELVPTGWTWKLEIHSYLTLLSQVRVCVLDAQRAIRGRMAT